MAGEKTGEIYLIRDKRKGGGNQKRQRDRERDEVERGRMNEYEHCVRKRKERGIGKVSGYGEINTRCFFL